MMRHLSTFAGVSLIVLAFSAQAVIVDFDGGVATLRNGATVNTDNVNTYQDVDFYKEDGFTADFVGNTATFAAIIGNYEGDGDAIIHGHWAGGGFGDLQQIVFKKDDATDFDLNYFIITSNTQIGGGAATGNELTYVTHDGGQDPILLPSVTWGTYPGAQVFLPSSYDNIFSFEFHAENQVACFGMDEFYIDEPAPPPVPEPSTVVTGALLLLPFGLQGIRRLRNR